MQKFVPAIAIRKNQDAKFHLWPIWR